MDRFKFKAIIKVDCFDKEEEDKVVNLVIENVAVENGDAGFSESELTKTLDKLSLTDEEKENICVYLFDNCSIDYGNDTYFWCDKAKIIQCTGLKDKNGNLIYESDYVKANDVIYRVFWNKTKISLANILNGDIIDISETITMEIVGNEHKKDNISEIPKNTERRFN